MGSLVRVALKSEQLIELNEPDRCVLSGVHGYAQAEAQKEEDEGKVQVSLPPGFQPGGTCPGTLPPHGILKKSMGRLLSSKTSSNILPEVESTHEDGNRLSRISTPCSRGISKRAVIPLNL